MIRTLFILVLGMAGAALGAAPAAPAACEVLPAEAWSSVMGYAAAATPVELSCTYVGPGKSGGQLRILAVASSNEEADASVKRLRSHPTKGSHDPRLTAFGSQGSVVFSISLFQPAATASTAAQLEKLVASAKQHLAK